MGAVTVPDTRELVEQVRAGIGACRYTDAGAREEAFVSLAALAARVEELTEALERSENDWTFLFNLADYSDLAPEVLRALAKVNLERARAVLVRESGGQP